MKRSTGEWIDKAEGDYRSAGKLLAGESPECDQACFFAQQCAEKDIKTVLNERDRAFPKTHDLKELVERLSPPDSALGDLRPRLERLSQWSMLVRYPGFFANAENARQAVNTAAEVRRICRRQLGVQQV